MYVSHGGFVTMALNNPYDLVNTQTHFVWKNGTENWAQMETSKGNLFMSEESMSAKERAWTSVQLGAESDHKGKEN